MQSFAFWYEANSKIDNVSAKLNFNLWTECKFKKNPTFLDIGFLLTNWENIKKLNFFVPFFICKSNITDLGEFLKTAELACAIFNEDLQPITTEATKSFELKNTEAKIDYTIYCLDEDTDLTLTPYPDNNSDPNDSGTIISIDLSDKNLDKTKQIYFRFRIKNVNFDNLIRKYSSDKHGLQSIFNTTYTVDFRFYNKRSLNKSLLEEIDKHYIMPIESVHFLIMTKTYVNLITSDCKGRKLEEKVWNSYAEASQEKKKTKDLIAYHFKEKFKQSKDKNENTTITRDNPFGACEFFIKYEVEQSIWPIYLLITIGLGAFGSFLATLFTHYIFPKC